MHVSTTRCPELPSSTRAVVANTAARATTNERKCINTCLASGGDATRASADAVDDETVDDRCAPTKTNLRTCGDRIRILRVMCPICIYFIHAMCRNKSKLGLSTRILSRLTSVSAHVFFSETHARILNTNATDVVLTRTRAGAVAERAPEPRANASSFKRSTPPHVTRGALRRRPSTARARSRAAASASHVSFER